MDSIKKLIIIISIIVIVLIIAILVILNLNSSELGQTDDVIDNAEESVDVEENNLLVQDNNTFYSIEKNLQNYYLYIKVQNKQAVYEMTSQIYIEEHSLTQENILEQFPQIVDDNYEFKLKELYLNDSNIYPIYYASGELLQNDQKEKYYFVIYVDQSTASLEIEPITEEQYIEKVQSEQQNEERKIERKQYNQLNQVTVTTEEIAKKYFQDYIYNAVHDVQMAYSSLNEEYQKAKYPTLQQYQQLLQTKQDELVSMDIYSIKQRDDFATEDEYIQYIANLQQKGLTQYSVTEYEDYTEYVGIDDYNNYYIFQVTSPMQYKIILDTYTIDLPIFTERYANSTEEEKVTLNIQRVFEAINQQDYSYVYNKLDETFKQNNFSTLESFENYAKENFFMQNQVTIGKLEKQNDIYMYEITIRNAIEENSSEITKTIVMQLKEGTDFVMSFSI